MKEVGYMLYKNISYSVKTFYGVEFKPGETKEVPGYINHLKMIVVNKLPNEASNKQSKLSQDKQKKSSEKSSVIQSSTSEAISEDLVEDSGDKKSSSSKD